MAQGLVCLTQATNTLEPLSLGIPKALSHLPSVRASAEVSDSFQESPTDSQAFLHMTSLPLMYYINMKLQLLKYHLIHSTSLLLSSRDFLLFVNITPI